MRKSFLLLLLAAMFTMVSCENNESTKQQQSEEELCINNLMAQCQNFDSQTLVQNLPGNWIRDSYLIYDEKWSTIEKPFLVMGTMNADGLEMTPYTFAVDGTGTYSYEDVSPTFETVVINFTWSYDAESRKFLISSDNIYRECVVSGFNGAYLVLDYVNHLYDSYTDKHTYSYVREILKKSQN